MVPVGSSTPLRLDLTNTIQHPHHNQNYIFNHVALSVPDLDKAIEWYSKHFGFRRIRPDGEMDHAKGPNYLAKVYGDKLHKVRIAWLTTGNSVGFELFQFIDPPVKQPDLENWTLEEQYQRGGVFHICLTVPDPDAVCDIACEDGATRIGETVETYDGEKTSYLRDPWGIVIELMSCSFEQLLGNR